MGGQAIPKSPTIEAQKFVLKDKRGKVRAVLGEGSEDEPLGLLLYDKNQKPRAVLGLKVDDSPILGLADDHGGYRVLLDPAEGLHIQGNGPSVSLGVRWGTEPTLQFSDKDGWTRALLFVSNVNSSPVLQFLDPRGNTRAWMGAMADGKAQVVLTSRPTQGSIPSNATLEVAADGTMILRFFRAGTIWKAP